MDAPRTPFDPPPSLDIAKHRSVPHQPASDSSRDGARWLTRDKARLSSVQQCIVAALDAAGPSGLTIEQLAEEVTRRRGFKTKETTICGRIAGDPPELDEWLVKSGRREPSAANVYVDVYVHRRYNRKRETPA